MTSEVRRVTATTDKLGATRNLTRVAPLARGIAARQIVTCNTPATLLRWPREPVAQKWPFLERRSPGRPRTATDIEPLVVRMAYENPSRGNTRIQGALLNLEIKVGHGTLRRILKDHLIEPAPARQS